jgi:hypothetical protein
MRGDGTFAGAMRLRPRFSEPMLRGKHWPALEQALQGKDAELKFNATLTKSLDYYH